VRRTGDINTLPPANVHAANLAGRVINISRVSCMPVTKPCRSGRAGSYAAVDRDVVIVGWPWPSGDAGPASSRIWNTTDLRALNRRARQRCWCTTDPAIPTAVRWSASASVPALSNRTFP